MKILITGGAGYVGSRLVPKLLKLGHEVIIYDTCWFGFPAAQGVENLSFVVDDIRRVGRFCEVCEHAGIDVVMHLACIANDSSFDLDPALGKSINFDAFEPLVLAAKAARVKRFIYCSTSSVYGISDDSDITEEHALVPVTDYNRYKAACEPLLLEHLDDNFEGVIIRPATVCGPSPRQRFDLTVNILTLQAWMNHRITVFGGKQMRPNLHIEDMVRAYITLLDAPKEKIQGQIFNCGYQNLSVTQIAQTVKKIVDQYFPDKRTAIDWSETTDTRSYHINSDKIRRILDFHPKHSIEHAIRDLCDWLAENKFPNALTDDRYYNVKRMKAIGAC